jgi:hypothetical protein
MRTLRVGEVVGVGVAVAPGVGVALGAGVRFGVGEAVNDAAGAGAGDSCANACQRNPSVIRITALTFFVIPGKVEEPLTVFSSSL